MIMELKQSVMKFNTDIKNFVTSKKSIFEKLASTYKSQDIRDLNKYSILNYPRIMSDTIDYIQGFTDYVKDGKTDYMSKVLGLTLEHYGKMTTDPKYRTVMDLKSMAGMSEQYLELTTALMNMCNDLSKYVEDPKNEVPFTTQKIVAEMVSLTNNHYNRISKVYSDDMDIRLWLMCMPNKYLKHDIPAKLRADFQDKTTPVMHYAGK